MTRTTTRNVVGALALAAFVLTIFLANWAFDRYGFVPVWPGLEAPAAVYFVGAAFLFRDLAQRLLGRWPIVPAILAGAGLSYLVADARVAVASAVAFLASESLDFLVYSLLERRFSLAVAVSNVAGAALDSVLFLWIALGGLGLFWGQLVGKLWVTALALPLVLLARRRIPAWTST